MGWLAAALILAAYSPAAEQNPACRFPPVKERIEHLLSAPQVFRGTVYGVQSRLGGYEFFIRVSGKYKVRPTKTVKGPLPTKDLKLKFDSMSDDTGQSMSGWAPTDYEGVIVAVFEPKRVIAVPLDCIEGPLPQE